MNELRPPEQLIPEFRHFFIGPGSDLFRVNVKHHMIVVVHHRIGTQIDGEDG